MSDTAFWLLIFGVIAVILIVALVVLEWVGRRDAKRFEAQCAGEKPWSLRTRRDQELDAITRGREDRR